MSASIFLIMGPLLWAFITYLVRRWQVAAVSIGVLAIVFIGGLVATVPLDVTGGGFDGLIDGEPWIVLGRTILLTEQIRTTLIIAYLTMAILFLLSLLFPQGASFVPNCLIILSILAVLLMVRPPEFGAATLVIMAGVVAILIQSERTGSSLGSMRYLTMYILAAPLLLIAIWMLETQLVSLVSTISGLIFLATIILLAGFPFHITVRPVVNESGSLVPVVTFGIVQLGVVVFGLTLLVENPNIHDNLQFVQFVRGSGLATVILAAVLTLTTRSLSGMVAYVLLLDIGATIIALSFSGPSATTVTMGLLLLRITGLILVAIGLALVRIQGAESPIDSGTDLNERLHAYRGMVRRTPLGVVVLIYGLLSLAGLPLTPGFGGRWLLIVLVAGHSPWLASVILLSIALTTVAILRWLARLMAADRDFSSSGVPENRSMIVIAGLVLIIGLLLALFPQLLLDYAPRAIGLF
jgi:NADH-quinone oxidoreductase subunit N